MTARIQTRQAEVLRQILEGDRVDLHTAMPGVVRSYDDETQTAEIALGVARVIPAADEDDPDLVEPLPILPSVPVLWPRASGGYLHIPIAAGDGVLVLFCESDLNRWRETGQAGEDPGVHTRHGLSGAVAIAGLHWRGNPNPDAAGSFDQPAGLRLGIEGGPRIDIRGSQIKAGGENPLAKSEPTSTILDAIVTDLQTLAAAINVIASGAVVVPTSAQAVAAANPIATSTLRGA